MLCCPASSSFFLDTPTGSIFWFNVHVRPRYVVAYSLSHSLSPLQVAKWPYLFSIAGNVRDLFEVRMFLLRWAHTLADLCVEFHVLNGRILLDGYAKSRVGR